MGVIVVAHYVSFSFLFACSLASVSFFKKRACSHGPFILLLCERLQSLRDEIPFRLFGGLNFVVSIFGDIQMLIGWQKRIRGEESGVNVYYR
jgi:hypothetical protein